MRNHFVIPLWGLLLRYFCKTFKANYDVPRCIYSLKK